MAATRKRHARHVARRFAAEVLRQTEIVHWASDKSDLSEEEIAVADDELKRIAGRIDEQRAAHSFTQHTAQTTTNNRTGKPI